MVNSPTGQKVMQDGQNFNNPCETMVDSPTGQKNVMHDGQKFNNTLQGDD